jgi:hypothetical protein
MGMKKALGTTLVAAQLMGVWLAGAQTNHVSATKQQQPSVNEANAKPVAAAGTDSNPVISVSPGSLDFGLVPVGETSSLTLTVKNGGSGTLTGAAIASPPFGVASNGSYALGSSQSQVLVVRYTPTTEGTNRQSVALSGGGGATVIVSGRSVQRPLPPANLRIVGTGR